MHLSMYTHLSIYLYIYLSIYAFRLLSDDIISTVHMFLYIFRPTPLQVCLCPYVPMYVCGTVEAERVGKEGGGDGGGNVG